MECEEGRWGNNFISFAFYIVWHLFAIIFLGTVLKIIIAAWWREGFICGDVSRDLLISASHGYTAASYTL